MSKKSWVRLRAEFNIENVFGNLWTIVERDTKDMCGVLEQRRKPFRFSARRQGVHIAVYLADGSGKVREDSCGNRHFVSFQRQSNCIEVGAADVVEDGPSFKVRLEWDPDNRSYTLAIGCEKVDLERVSQRALEDWFFYKFD